MTAKVMVDAEVELAVHTGPQDGWRSRVAWWFRGLAEWFDRAPTLTVKVYCSETLTEDEVVAMLDAGFDHTYRLLEEHTKNAAYDRAVDTLGGAPWTQIE